MVTASAFRDLKLFFARSVPGHNALFDAAYPDSAVRFYFRYSIDPSHR